MEQIIDNSQKHENYREQFKRLKKAMNRENAFYLEAIFIEYSIIEDRAESVLKHMGKWDSYLKKRDRRPITIDSKIRYIQSFAKKKNTPENSYFGDEMLDEILEWKGKRNDLIHALLKQNLSTEELEKLAQDGKHLAKMFRSRSTSFNRLVQKKREKL